MIEQRPTGSAIAIEFAHLQRNGFDRFVQIIERQHGQGGQHGGIILPFLKGFERLRGCQHLLYISVGHTSTGVR